MNRRFLLHQLAAGMLLCSNALAQKAFVDGSPLHTRNAATRASLGTISRNGNFDGMRLSADSTKLFTYNETMRRLYIASTATNAMLDSINFTGPLFDFMPGPGNSLYYSMNPTSRIYKMDLGTKALVDSSGAITASGSARFTARPGTNEIWLTVGHEVHYFTTTSMALNAVPVGVSSSQYIGTPLVFNAAGSKVYYNPAPPSGQPGKLYQMDAATKQKLDSLVTPAPLGRVKTLTLGGNDTTMYLAYWGEWPNEPYKIYRASSVTMDMVDSVTTPRRPFGIAERPGTQELWVVYHYDAKIGILDRSAGLASIDSITVGIFPKMLLFVPLQASNVAGQYIKPQLAVFPNPSTGSFMIKSNAPGVATYQVQDLTGRCVKIGKLASTTELSLNEFPAGVYLLQASGDGWKTSMQLVKQ